MKKLFKLILLLTTLIFIRCGEDIEPCLYEFQLIGEHEQFGYTGGPFGSNLGLLSKLIISKDTIYLGDYEYYFGIYDRGLGVNYEDTLYMFNPILLSLNLLEDSSFELRYRQGKFYRGGEFGGFMDGWDGAGFDFDGFSIVRARYGTWTQNGDQLQLNSENWTAYTKLIEVNDGDKILENWLNQVGDVGYTLDDPGEPFRTYLTRLRRRAFYLELTQVSQDTVFHVSFFSGIELPECASNGINGGGGFGGGF